MLPYPNEINTPNKSRLNEWKCFDARHLIPATLSAKFRIKSLHVFGNWVHDSLVENSITPTQTKRLVMWEEKVSCEGFGTVNTQKQLLLKPYHSCTNRPKPTSNKFSNKLSNKTNTLLLPQPSQVTNRTSKHTVILTPILLPRKNKGSEEISDKLILFHK